MSLDVLLNAQKAITSNGIKKKIVVIQWHVLVLQKKRTNFQIVHLNYKKSHCIENYDLFLSKKKSIVVFVFNRSDASRILKKHTIHLTFQRGCHGILVQLFKKTSGTTEEGGAVILTVAL